ncbi:NAD(P)-binding protein [Lentinus tigrinus ALCF2SS1-7]|uniref:NAD(P)-binding protein n=1 Tax=Lentinus tigrinus ALCF2SS1-6 TaxID=1328759 RepID=A0A5C2S437_9APHY|nr:NAD(P)-binding protein [Lentinus tigrinus ALCF2SS1-6]RPD72901.1 NAD(P)-binding protein [Lentinus tigrinus ALCF2SS1-7]
MSACITSNPHFDEATTAEEVAASLASSIAGKTILITGVTPGGLGAHFAKVTAAHNPKLLILAGRSASNLASVAHDISAAHGPGVATRTLELDLSSQAQVRRAAAEVLAWPEVRSIDVLVNNAGVMACAYGTTADGLEMHLGTNYVGHFLFTMLLVPKLLASEAKGGPRVVNVSSDGHRLSDIRWDDLGFQDGKTYHKWRAYGQSKTANILFSVALAEKLGLRGLKAFSLHPGAIATNLGRYMSDGDLASLQALDKELGNKGYDDFRLKSLGAGTATHVVAAFDPELGKHNSAYLQDCQRAPDDDLKPYAVDKASVAKLWTLSEELVREKFDYGPGKRY